MRRSPAEPLNAIFLTREIQVRKVEVLVLGGHDAEALALADELVPLGSGTFEERFVAMLHRLRGWALLRVGRLDDARAAIDLSLTRAEAISVAYEIALALRARAEIGRRAGEPGGAAADDARAVGLFAALGTLVEPPLLLGS